MEGVCVEPKSVAANNTETHTVMMEGVGERGGKPHLASLASQCGCLYLPGSGGAAVGSSR